jgi:acetyltransferase-like isoleucine patch superfamily enzyme
MLSMNLRKMLNNPLSTLNYVSQKLYYQPRQRLRISILNRYSDIEIHPSVKISLQSEIKATNGIINIGENCAIRPHAKLLPYGGHIKIGTDSTVNPFTILHGHGGLDIGDGVRIASHNTIIPANHVFSDPNQFIYKQGITTEGIVIEDDVWIGTGCRILDGVHIGEGAVIAAGSVVNDSVSPYTVVGGNPASEIKSRY